MFPLTPDQHHWLDVATEDEGWCSFSAEVWHVANSKIRTKAVDKTLKTFINDCTTVKIHEKSQISRNFMEMGVFHGKCHGREIVN